MADLRKQAVAGIANSTVTQVGRLLLQLLTVVILSRMLAPSDFGLVAIVMSVVGVAELLRDMGLSGAAIQRKELPLPLASNLFWLNTALGGLMMLLAMASGPLLAMMMNEPRLTWVAIGLAPMFLLSGIAAQHRVTLIRDLRFGSIGLLDLLAQGMGLLAAVLTAWWTHDYRALIAQSFVAATVTVIAFFIAGGWTPMLPGRGRDTRSMSGFAGAMLGSSLLTYVSLNVDTFVVGQQLGTAPVGLYNRGVQLVRSPLRQILRPFSTVLFPLMSRAQDNAHQLGILARRAQLFSSLPVFVIAAVIASVPEQTVNLLLGSGWSEVAPVSALMAVGVAVGTVASVGATVLSATGQASQLTRLSVVTLMVTVLAVFAGVPSGITGVALALAVASLVTCVISLAWVTASTEIPTGPLYAQAAALVAAGAGAVVLSRLLLSTVAMHDVTAMVAASAVVGACYGLLLGIPSIRSDVAATWSVIRTGRSS